MTNTSQFDLVLAHITEHPDLSSKEISSATRIAPCVVFSLLTPMVRKNLVSRHKVGGIYRYRAVKQEAEPVNLNAMFNSLLRSAREGRV